MKTLIKILLGLAIVVSAGFVFAGNDCEDPRNCPGDDPCKFNKDECAPDPNRILNLEQVLLGQELPIYARSATSSSGGGGSSGSGGGSGGGGSGGTSGLGIAVALGVMILAGTTDNGMSYYDSLGLIPDQRKWNVSPLISDQGNVVYNFTYTPNQVSDRYHFYINVIDDHLLRNDNTQNIAIGVRLAW